MYTLNLCTLQTLCICKSIALSDLNLWLIRLCLMPFSPSELPENWTDTRETLVDGMTFNLRHMRMTLVDQPKGEEVSAAAIKRIVATVLLFTPSLPAVF